MRADRPVPPEFKPPDTAGDLTAALAVLLSGRTLTAEKTAAAFESIMTGEAHHGEIGALLGLLATRIPTTDEILGAARVMRKHVDRVEPRCDPGRIASWFDAVDVGTHDPRGAEDLVGAGYACCKQGQQRADLAVVARAGHDHLEGGGGLAGGQRAAGEKHGQRGGEIAGRLGRLELGWGRGGAIG